MHVEAKLRLAIAMQAEAAAGMVSREHLAQAVRDAQATLSGTSHDAAAPVCISALTIVDPSVACRHHSPS